MFRLYGKKKTEAILARCAGYADELEQRFGVPAAALKAVVYQEVRQIDLMDVAADAAVRLYWAAYRLLRRPPRFGKRDSSTGYAQVFAATAIDSINFAADRGIADYRALGLLTDHRLQKENPADLRMIWLMLHRNRQFNLLAAALTLRAAAQEMTGRIDFSAYSPDELQLIFTRYNAKADHVTAYGREVYARYSNSISL